METKYFFIRGKRHKWCISAISVTYRCGHNILEFWNILPIILFATIVRSKENVTYKLRNGFLSHLTSIACLKFRVKIAKNPASFPN